MLQLLQEDQFLDINHTPGESHDDIMLDVNNHTITPVDGAVDSGAMPTAADDHSEVFSSVSEVR